MKEMKTKTATENPLQGQNGQNQQEKHEKRPTAMKIAEKLLEPLEAPTPICDSGFRLSVRSKAGNGGIDRSPFSFRRREEQYPPISQKSPFTNAFDLVFFNQGLASSPIIKNLTPTPKDMNPFSFDFDDELENDYEEKTVKEITKKEKKSIHTANTIRVRAYESLSTCVYVPSTNLKWMDMVGLNAHDDDVCGCRDRMKNCDFLVGTNTIHMIQWMTDRKCILCII